MMNKISLLFLMAIGTLQLSCTEGEVKTPKAERTSIGTGQDKITVIVVRGTPYEMGYSLGQAMKTEIKDCLTGFLQYGQIGDSARFNYENLDAAWTAVGPYIDKRLKEELKGLSEGSGIPLLQLQRAHMIPVLGNYACSGVAVCVSRSSDGHLYQIRNLDFTMGGGLQDYPTIVIYVPDGGIPHASATFAGFIGAHTGLNAKGIALSEKGASPDREYPFDMDGTHFSTLFRSLLYDADNLDEALTMVKNTKLIKRYRFYIGDGKTETMGAAKILVSSPDSVKLTIWKDNDSADEVAPKIKENVCYYTMNNDLAYDYITSNYGTFDSAKMIELSKLVADDDGNLENVVYDATNLEMWVAYANGRQVASSQPYIHLDLKKYIE